MFITVKVYWCFCWSA